jgi:hypothetical protein
MYHLSIHIEEFRTLMRHQGWTLDHQSGSHQIWYSPGFYRLSIQDRNGKVKGYQVKQFLMRLKEESNHE